MLFKVFKFSAVALGGIGAALFLAPVAAQAYTMDDYYAAVITVQSDQTAIDDVNADIASNQNDIAEANLYYPDAEHGCSQGGGFMGPSYEQIQECIEGWDMEWQGIVDNANANISGDEGELPGLELALNNDQNYLDLIKATLGIS